MITRTMDARRLNQIANHPDVRPYIGGEGPIDLTPIAQNPANVLIEAEHGGWVLQPILAGVYEIHTLFLKEGRGSAFFKAAREMLRWMFTRTDALEIVTKVPDDNPGAAMAALKVGFRERFHRDNAWAPGIGVSYQALTLDGWIARDGVIAKEGHAFHEALESAKKAAGSELPDHPEDAAHERVVGAAVLMARAGLAQKAVGVYGRWATFAGYATIEIVGPNLIDVRDAIVDVSGPEMAVLLVRGAPPHA